MATISSGASAGRRKSVSSEVPLVPFLDLLLCCVMFLLVTATWNQLARLNVSQRVPGTAIDAPEESAVRLTLAVLATGYELSRDTGERQVVAGHDANALRTLLDAWRKLDEGLRQVTIASEDGVPYGAIIAAMDVASGAGYTRLDIADRVR